MPKENKRQRLTAQTARILTNMIEVKLGPIIRAEREKYIKAGSEARKAHDEAYRLWYEDAQPSMLNEARRRPGTYVTMSDDDTRKHVVVDRAKLLAWYSNRNPPPVAPPANEALVKVVFASLERNYYGPLIVEVPKHMAAGLLALAAKIDTAFLEGDVAGLVTEIDLLTR